MPKNEIHFEKAYVVRVNRAQRAWRVAGILGLLVFFPLAAYLGISWYLGQENRELNSQVDRQAELIAALRAEVLNLEQLAANADLASEVDKNSLEQMRLEMVQSQERIELLGEQIRFYQSLMDPNPEKGGVYIETVDIEPSDAEGAYKYNIVVAQRSSNHRRVQGNMDLQLISEGKGDARQIFSLGELTESVDSLSLGFKFFQQLDGDFKLPEGFIPTKVRVTVRLDGDASPRVDETYVWKS